MNSLPTPLCAALIHSTGTFFSVFATSVRFSSYEDGKYVCRTKLLNLTDVANTEKKVPVEWINAAHNGVGKEFIDYALPLIQGEPSLPKQSSLPRFAQLKKVLVK